MGKNKKNKLIIILGTIFIILIAFISVIFIAKKNLKESKQKSLETSKEIIDDEVINKVDLPIEKTPKYTIKTELTIESGSILPTINDYFEEEVSLSENSTIKYYLNEKEVSLDIFTILKENIRYTKGINTLKVIINDTEEYISSLKIVDTTKPTIKLKDVIITTGDKYSSNNFLVEYSDNSSDNTYTLEFKDKTQASLTKVGTHKIVLTICDNFNNCLEESGNLIIKAKSTTNSNENISQNSNTNNNTNTKPSTTTKPNTNSETIKPPVNSNTTTKPTITLVKTAEEKVILKSNEIKYGIKNITYVMIKYNVYSDGSKKEISRGKEITEIDRSGFNGTTSSIKPEALNIYDKYESLRNSVLNISNEYRIEVSLENLTIDKDLSIMATIRAIEMAYADYFSHTRPDGRDWYTIWADYYNININSLNATIGENLAVGYTTASSACNGWKNSKLHYENIINKEFTKLGVGVYELDGKMYWVQLFQT